MTELIEKIALLCIALCVARNTAWINKQISIKSKALEYISKMRAERTDDELRENDDDDDF